MSSFIEDRLAIADLMTGWMYRDSAEWDKLRGLFTPGGEIEITWFEGKVSDFIAGSQRMGGSDLKTKHVITSPIVEFNGDKAIVETNCMIICYSSSIGAGGTTHARFYDLVEKRNAEWAIAKRQCIYDFSTFDFPHGPVDIEIDTVRGYPAEYAALAYFLEKSGFPLNRTFATKGSELEKKMKEEGRAWLDA